MSPYNYRTPLRGSLSSAFFICDKADIHNLLLLRRLLPKVSDENLVAAADKIPRRSRASYGTQCFMLCAEVESRARRALVAQTDDPPAPSCGVGQSVLSWSASLARATSVVTSSSTSDQPHRGCVLPFRFKLILIRKRRLSNIRQPSKELDLSAPPPWRLFSPGASAEGKGKICGEKEVLDQVGRELSQIDVPDPHAS
jgi:hypothetical protein